MGETERLLWETARVAGGEAEEAAWDAVDPEAVERCRSIRDAARERLGEGPAGRTDLPYDIFPDMGVHRAAMGMAALGDALSRCLDADADARALAGDLLVLLRTLQEEILQ